MPLTSEIRTGDGIYTLTIEGVNTTLDPQSVTLLDEAVLRWGDSGDGWGDYILPSTLKATLYDPDFNVVPVLDALDSREATATLEGPGGFKWAGWYSAEPIKRPFLSTRGGERPTFSLLFYDGLVDARQRSNRATFSDSRLQAISSELEDLNPEGAQPAFYSDIEWGTKYDGVFDISNLNFGGNSDAFRVGGFGLEEGRRTVDARLTADGDTLADLLNATCQALYARLYYSPTHGRYVFMPRERVGQGLTTYLYNSDETVTGLSLGERTKDVSAADVSQQPDYRRIQDAGVVRLELGEGHTISTEYFDADTTNGTAYLNPSSNASKGWTAFTIERNTAQGSLSNDPLTWTLYTDEFGGIADNLVVQFTANKTAGQNVPDDLEVQVDLINLQGTYTDTFTFAIGSQALPQENQAVFDLAGIVSGRAKVTFKVPTSFDDVSVLISEVNIFFADGSGTSLKRIDTYIVGNAVGLPDDASNPTPSRGEPVDVELLPYMEPTGFQLPLSDIPDQYGPVEFYEHTIYNITRRNPHFFRAQVRAAAQSVGVRTLQAQLRGAYGPEWQLRYPDKDGLKYVTGEGRKITFDTRRIETETYDLELPTNTGDA